MGTRDNQVFSLTTCKGVIKDDTWFLTWIIECLRFWKQLVTSQEREYIQFGKFLFEVEYAIEDVQQFEDSDLKFMNKDIHLEVLGTQRAAEAPGKDMRFFRKRDSTVREKWKKNKEGMMSEKPRENKISKKE